ncbi:MAG: sulfate ABC transporter permease subunit CysT [Candidatus Hydrogenedens sp.]
MKKILNKKSVLPGYGLSLGITWLYLSLIILLPLSTLYIKVFSGSLNDFISAVFSIRAIKAYQVSFGLSFISACINSLFGFLVAWVIVRYKIPFKGFWDALIDLPFALPTSVAGISLTWLYGPRGWIGSFLEAHGFKVVFTPIGIAIAMIFVSFPFAVRTIEPVLRDLDPEVEESARCLGASRLNIFQKIIFPTILPSMLTGFTLSFARSMGEYGSVIFIAGNQPLKTEIAPLLIVMRLEEYDYYGSASIAVFLLTVSFLLLLCLNFIQFWNKRYSGIT